MVEELFQKKFKKAIILMITTVGLNLGLSVCSLVFKGSTEFKGYLSGTLLSMVFSILWVFMVRKVSFSNPMVLFSLSLGSFPIKILVFAIFAFGGLLLFQMNQMYFGMAFLLGTVISLIIEVWFIITVNRIIRESKGE
ncbi:MAG TPA: hypothetical protein PK926_12515 [Spirochaetota bacterium]|nr:hypothetical protein [Spirochaetota bacterium]HPI89221.1 hypothetical protein [Spirochaetota bacterium]HPR48962.1 hypothetical protein [Spirochaetota bacterium]